MNSDYDIRLNNALKDFHKEVYDSVENQINDENREECDCPVCGEANHSIYCVKDGFAHKRCSSCQMVYLSPRFTGEATTSFYNSQVNEVYNESKFHHGSADASGDDVVNSQNLKIILNHITGQPQNMKLLEVGSGNGFFLRRASEHGFDVYGLELNAKLFEETKDISENIYHQDLFERKFDDALFDVIYMRDVIEHIHNPVPFIKELHRIAKEGCILIFNTHNIDSMINQLTKEYHTVIFAFEHPVHWSPKSLSLAGNNAGFKHLKTYQKHQGQSMRRILSYILNPSFTYIFKPSVKSMTFKKLLFRLTGLPGIFRLDAFIMRSLSRLLGKGATMNVIFTK